jgi:hypothetical protein
MRKLILFGSLVGAFVFALSCSDQRGTPVAPTEPSFAKGGPKVKSISVSPSSATIAVAQTVQLNRVGIPAELRVDVLTWGSSNTSVATVSSSGLVTGVGAGTATINCERQRREWDFNGDGNVGTIDRRRARGCRRHRELFVVRRRGDGERARRDSGTVFTLGDNVYDNGTATEYANCYDPAGTTQVAHKTESGNHEYNTANATGYYGYFGAAAGDPTKGYYSFDLGDWHVIVLNSNLSCAVISCAAGSPQEQWLRADLAANTKPCTLAYWHHPRFNSGASHGNDTDVAPFWDALYQYNADVILNGHEHVYERFAPQTPSAVADPARGIRQFTVGTGGRSHYTFGAIQPNSQVREGNTYGVLKLTLRSTGYDWQFVPVAGASFTDSGSGTCH